jgi:hypothetical protein
MSRAPIPVGELVQYDRQWLMRPVLAKMFRLYELYDGTYDLCQVAEMNEALDVEAENSWRVQEELSKQQNR